MVEAYARIWGYILTQTSAARFGYILDKSEIRDASTVIVLRDRETSPRVLMGQRGANAAFMPNKYVFPGGAVDPGDGKVSLGRSLPDVDAALLAKHSARTSATLAAAAIRELWEETGQILGTPAPWTDAPHGWRGFARSGHRPDASALQFVFRAVTPNGRTRRFDARFFMVEVENLVTDPDDFTNAEDELGHLHWVPLTDARTLDLPFITEIVLAEITSGLHHKGSPHTVPFFRNDDEAHLVTRLGSPSQLGG